MAEKRVRDYAREYQRRNDLAKQRGFNSYGQQRRYVEYTGTPTRYVVAPSEPIYYPNPRFDFADYSQGQDERLDIFLRMAKSKDMDEAQAYDRYMRKGRGEPLSRGQLKDLEMDVFDLDEDETWY